MEDALRGMQQQSTLATSELLRDTLKQATSLQFGVAAATSKASDNVQLHGRILLDRIGRPGEYDDEQAFAKEEAEALEEMDDLQRTEYLRAKAFVQSNPPDSLPTDISLSQYLAIQEKGVSAWEFEPELEIANCFVEARTEIEFF
ncbi:hypothetical protein EYC84_007807 [Monilinia fructicola]|uniref:Uncharacterized protein n=1 Tax=Monilinia fructicola TaxID=38448 RepID=A0A5M9JHC1_MONFR|nr:hypothetical protein EYC84_007807 [Monilinia fructicola]